MSFRPTALGRVFLITPPLADGAPWLLHRFSLAGNWRGCSLHATRADAAKHRRDLFRHHANLAAKRVARKLAGGISPGPSAGPAGASGPRTPDASGRRRSPTG